MKIKVNLIITIFLLHLLGSVDFLTKDQEQKKPFKARRGGEGSINISFLQKALNTIIIDISF